MLSGMKAQVPPDGPGCPEKETGFDLDETAETVHRVPAVALTAARIGTKTCSSMALTRSGGRGSRSNLPSPPAYQARVCDANVEMPARRFGECLAAMK